MNEGPVWITGAGGLIGHYLVQTASQYAAGIPIRGLTRSQLELTDSDSVRREYSHQQPRAIIHCAALSRSPDAQANPSLARRLNVEVTSFLADLAVDTPFFFFSSDLVFDGRTGNYDEAAQVNPLSVYGETKVAAERIVLSNPKHTVIRTSLNGGISPTGDRGFNEQMRRACQAGQTVRLFTDEFRSPIAAAVTASVTWQLFHRNQPGLYHLAGKDRLSRWEIGQLLAPRWLHLNPRLEPASLKEYAGAPRPPDTSLNCPRIEQLLSIRLPGLAAWLASHPDIQF
jgi:dTDP-4-dehydrorhamnose reductase